MTPKKSMGTLEFYKNKKMKCSVPICACEFVLNVMLTVVCFMCTNFGFGMAGTSDSKMHVKVNII